MKDARLNESDKSKVFIENEQSDVEMKENYLKLIEKTALLCLGLEDINKGCEINILITDDSSIAQINKQFRHIESSTDVLSFPMTDIRNGRMVCDNTDYDRDEGLLLLGDIVISAQTAKRQAEHYGHSFERELAFLTSHGIFHLLGYDHMEKDDEEIMISKQESVLERLDLKRE